MIRTLFLDQTSKLGGAELSLLSIAKARKSTSKDRVVLFEGGQLEQLLLDEGLDVTVSPLGDEVSGVKKESGLATQLAAVRGTQRQVQRVRRLAGNFEVVYANTAKALVIGALAFRNRPQPLIYHLRDIVTASHFSRANRWALVTLANCYAAKVIANSQATADAFVEAGGKRSLVTVIPNGFEIEPFDRAISAFEPPAEKDGPGRKVVAVFGRLSPWKGQDVAIRAVAGLEDVELWIVGEALFGEDRYAGELRELVSKLGVEERVKFLGFRDDVLDLMQQADIVAHTSRAPEPFGRVVVEGMLSARPVIASRGGGAVEIVEEGITGLLSDMGHAEDLARCIRKLADDPALAKQLATTAARQARERYSIEHCVAQTNAVIEEVAAKKRKAKRA